MGTVRVYHFIGDEYGRENLRNRRLKLSFSDKVNDLFELRPFDFGVGHEAQRLRRAWGQAIKKHARFQGFISFSETWSVPTMWAHYANNHAGICLGFDVPAKRAERIDYRSELRPLDRRVLSDVVYNREMVKFARSTKSNHWAYEKEWRCWFSLCDAEKKAKSQNPDELIFADFCQDLTLKEVIFGCRSELSTRKIQSLLSQSDEVTFSTARPSFRKFEMVRQKDKRLQK